MSPSLHFYQLKICLPYNVNKEIVILFNQIRLQKLKFVCWNLSKHPFCYFIDVLSMTSKFLVYYMSLAWKSLLFEFHFLLNISMVFISLLLFWAYLKYTDTKVRISRKCSKNIVLSRNPWLYYLKNITP